MNGKRFSITTIIYLFILLDIIVFYYAGLTILFILIMNEASWIFGLLLGLKGQSKFGIVMHKLLSITDDPKYNDFEELRGHKIKQQIRHDCLEYDFWFLKNKEKIKKKTKNFGGKFKMKIEAIRDLLYWLGGIIIGIGLILDDILIMYNVRPLWFIAFNVIYFSGDFLYFWYLKNYWDIKREDVPPVEPPIRI